MLRPRYEDALACLAVPRRLHWSRRLGVRCPRSRPRSVESKLAAPECRTPRVPIAAADASAPRCGRPPRAPAPRAGEICIGQGIPMPHCPPRCLRLIQPCWSPCARQRRQGRQSTSADTAAPRHTALARTLGRHARLVAPARARRRNPPTRLARRCEEQVPWRRSRRLPVLPDSGVLGACRG